MSDEKPLELLNMLRELHNLSGFRLSIHDTKFREIMAYPTEKSSYCRLIQSCEAGYGQCVENDRRAFGHVRESQATYLYQCRFGLYEAVAPLYILGNLVGYLMMGQSVDGSPGNRETLLQNGLAFTGRRDDLARVCGEVCVCEKEKILSCMKILDICAQYITLSNRFFLDRSNLADRIKQYIDANFAQKITLEDLCLHLFCSRTTATQAFKGKYGMGINAYLTSVRIETAKKLLSGTQKSVREVGECCGYPDQNYFCKAFIRQCGQTPSGFRKQKAADPEEWVPFSDPAANQA